MAAFLAWGCDSGRSAVSASPEGVEARPALQSQQVSREPAPPATVTAVASQLGNCSIAGVVQVKPLGENTYELSRATLQRVVEAVSAYSRSGIKPGRLVASKARDGRTGLRVFGVEPHAGCGLQLSDLVLQVNGAAVAAEGALEQKHEALLTADRISVEIEREGALVSLTYVVR